jgi:NAD(P)-dependent dehydrogenase (short-subunit alcohol dehydrogenase family)
VIRKLISRVFSGKKTTANRHEPAVIPVSSHGITRDRMFAKMERDGWDAVIATNLTSLFNMTKQVSAKMAERGWGRIVNISPVGSSQTAAGPSVRLRPTGPTTSCSVRSSPTRWAASSRASAWQAGCTA